MSTTFVPVEYYDVLGNIRRDAAATSAQVFSGLAAGQVYTNPPFASGGGVISVQNAQTESPLDGRYELVKPDFFVNPTVRTLTAGANVTLVRTDNDITINASGTLGVSSVQNTNNTPGVGEAALVNMPFDTTPTVKTILAGSGISVTSTGTSVTITNSLPSTTAVQSVTCAVPASSGCLIGGTVSNPTVKPIESVDPLGPGNLVDYTPTKVLIRTLIAGSGVTVVPVGSSVQINSTASSPAGNSGNVQYNNGAGGFGADALFTYDVLTQTLGVPNASVSAFRLTTGAIAGYVATSDAFGNMTWQPNTSVTSIANIGTGIDVVLSGAAPVPTVKRLAAQSPIVLDDGIITPNTITIRAPTVPFANTLQNFIPAVAITVVTGTGTLSLASLVSTLLTVNTYSTISMSATFTAVTPAANTFAFTVDTTGAPAVNGSYLAKYAPGAVSVVNGDNPSVQYTGANLLTVTVLNSPALSTVTVQLTVSYFQ